MILECSICHKRYSLPRKNLPAPQLLPNNHFGWCVSCDRCQSSWILDQALVDTMAIDPKDPVPLALVSERTSKRSLKKALLSMKNLKPSRKKSIQVILGATLCLCIFFSGYLFFRSRTPSSMNKGSLIVQQVRSSIRPTPKGKEVMVVGEVLNNNSTPVGLLPLKVKIWTPCLDSSKSECLVSSWDYKWSISEVLPGERISFQTAQSLNQDIQQISKIEVTLP